MSYARWSGHSDVYVYASGQSETTIHVATRRWTWSGQAPVVPPFDPGDPAAMKDWLARQTEVRSMVGSPEYGAWQAVPAPFAGQSYHLETAQEAAAMLAQMTKVGVVVPDGLVDDLAAE